jgi:RimJ/RimL family protein N-acetyltransferase
VTQNVSPPDTAGRDTSHGVSTRPWTRDDASWYVDHLDGEIARWTLEPDGLDEASWRASLAKSEVTGAMWHAIECCGEPVGNVKAVPLSDHIAISYWVAMAERGKGYASLALAEVTRLAVENSWGRPIELEIHTGNEASIRTAIRVGYVFHEMRATCNACADDTGRSAIYRWRN